MDEGMREMDEGMRDRTAGACRRLPQRSVAQCRVVLCVCGGPVLTPVGLRAVQIARRSHASACRVCRVVCARRGVAPRRCAVPCGVVCHTSRAASPALSEPSSRPVLSPAPLRSTPRSAALASLYSCMRYAGVNDNIADCKFEVIGVRRY